MLRGQKFNSARPTVMVSPTNPLDEIQPNLVFGLLTCMGRATSIFFLPCSLGRGQKVKYHLISITRSISKIFIPNFCVFSQMKDTKHI